MRGYIDTSVGQIHYRHEGDAGPPIVLLHCANFSSNLYERALPLLGQRMQAWAFDAPGVGLSDAPPAPTLPQIAGWLLEALDGLAIQRPVVAGLHTGSRIALQMAQLRGADQFAAAVLMGIGPLSADFRKAHPPRATHLHIESDKDATQWSKAVERYHLIYPDQDPPTEDDGWLQHLYTVESMSKVVPMRTPWPGGPVEGSGLDPVFRNWPGPLLVFNTPEDLFAGTDEEMVAWHPRAEWKLIEGIGPHLMLRDPEVYVAEVISFLERHGVLETP